MNALTSLFFPAEDDLDTRLRTVVRNTAPQWPLKSFIAVNPFMAMGGKDFAEAAVEIARTRGARLVPDVSLPEALPTLADAAGQAGGRPVAAFVTERISQWAAGYYDQGQAVWGNPWRDLPPFAAWRAEARIDRAPELWGMPGFRAMVAGLPGDPVAAAEDLLRTLNLPEAVEALYLQRLFGTVGGWAALLRHRDWSAMLAGGSDDGPRDLLVIRLAWDVLVARALTDEATINRWRAAICAAPPAVTPDLSGLEAREGRWRDALLRTLAQPAPDMPAPAVQAVFCIDVRSEPFRHALEQAWPAIETSGFAGFFGLPVTVLGVSGVRQPACPPLVRPHALVCEALPGTRDSLQPLRAAIDGLKRTGASALGYVESFGLGAAGSLIASGLGVKSARRAPDAALSIAAASAGPEAQARASLAAGLLKGAGLRQPRAALVVLVGHEGQSRNNPHAAGLHCGACGGRSGAVNARAAAMILNDPEVRAILKAQEGIDIPGKTWFAAAVHNTTTDELRLLDAEHIPGHLNGEKAAFEKAAATAGASVRRLRSPALGEAPTLKAFRGRAADPSQVRPEWGLAGCAGFIAAPRRLTRGKTLGGRIFLHSYEWGADDGFAVLEQILTAPVIVASWINLQYFASAAAPDVFGAGNKVLHNVVGGNLGVLEGNGGDLRLGLPMQSISDGQTLRHEALRLSVIVAAPTSAIDGVLSRHRSVRDLVENRWIHLFAMDDDGRVTARRTAAGWQAVA